jgi:single-stranded-DNA-specific exonuclease
MKDIMRKLLKSKGLNKESVQDFINFNIKKHSPFLFRDMKKAIDTIKKHKCIVIFGDYDCDGICATTIMYIGLKQYGFDVSYDIPIREKHGYGVSIGRIDKYIIDGKPTIDCIITVDNGITSLAEADYAKYL